MWGTILLHASFSSFASEINPSLFNVSQEASQFRLSNISHKLPIPPQKKKEKEKLPMSLKNC